MTCRGRFEVKEFTKVDKQQIINGIAWVVQTIDTRQMNEQDMTLLIQETSEDYDESDDGLILDTVSEWRAGNLALPLVVGAHQIMNVYFSLKREADRLKEVMDSHRQTLANYVAEHGSIKNSVGTASMTKPSKRVSYDASSVDSVMAKLASAGLDEYAKQLADARKESTTEPYIVIKAVKE